jgi:hypothetical protein
LFPLLPWPPASLEPEAALAPRTHVLLLLVYAGDAAGSDGDTTGAAMET